MVNRYDAKQSASVNDYSPAAMTVLRRRFGSRLPRSRISRGQAAAEFALIAPVVIIVMLVGVQFALIGQAALALSQEHPRSRAMPR